MRMRVRPPGRADVAWFVAAFLALQIGFIFFVDWGPMEIYDAEAGKRLRLLKELRRQHPSEPVLAVIGSSRPIMGVLPSHLMPLKSTDGRAVLPFNFVHQGAGASDGNSLAPSRTSLLRASASVRPSEPSLPNLSITS